MITTAGKTHIKRYLAGLVPSISRSIAFGIGGGAEALGDTKLNFEIDRSDVSTVSYDFVNNKLIFKAPLPEEFGGTVYEAALYSMGVDTVAGEFGSKLISTFDSDTEEWLDLTSGLASTFTTTGERIGEDALIQSPVASATKTDIMSDVFLDLSGHSAADRFVFALNVATVAPSSIFVRFMTDASNYYTFSLATAVGYKVVEATKGSASVTGTPNWANITEVRVSTVAAAGGTANVTFDGIRIEDVDTINPDYVMVARELLAVPYVKQEGKVQEIEFTLDVNL